MLYGLAFRRLVKAEEPKEPMDHSAPCTGEEEPGMLTLADSKEHLRKAELATRDGKRLREARERSGK